MASDVVIKQEATKAAKPEMKPEVKPVVKPAPAFEATYTIPELLEAAATEFKTNRVVVRAALNKAGKETYTMNEAKRIINEMKNKEVKA